MRILPNLVHLRAFEAVCRHLNISKAANELCVSHSAISQQIKALEQDLNVSLIDRSSHKIKLTAQGQDYAQTVTAVFDRLRNATLKMRQYHQARPWVFAVPNTLGLQRIIPKLSEWYEAHPELKIQLLLRRDVNEGGEADFGISYAPLDSANTGLILAEDQLVAIKAYGSDLDFKQNAALIRVSADLRKEDWPRWLEGSGVSVDWQAGFSFHETIQAIAAAKNGLGILVTHTFFVAEDLASQKLELAYPCRINTGMAYYFKAKDEVGNSEALIALRDWLVSCFRNG